MRWSFFPAASFLLVLPCALPAGADPPVRADYQKEIRPLLARYCFGCHGPDKPKAGVNLKSLRDGGADGRSRKLWKKVAEVLHGRAMPPEDKPQPAPAERERLTDWVEALLRTPPAAAPRDPGRVVIRRLNRAEYSNTICDLIPSLRPEGVPRYFDPARGFPAEGVWLGLHANIERSRVPVVDLPPDDVEHGFDNLGESLTLPPLLMEKYLAVTTEVLDRAQARQDPHVFPPSPGGKASRREAARALLAAFAPRAFRRPVTPAEIEDLLKLFDLADRRGDSFEAALKVPLQAVLLSPHFLFKVEREAGPAGGRGVRPVGNYELASRLSYFLWSTMPDANLLHLARRGTLRDPEVLQAQVRRMLRSPKAKALADNFAVQWLQLGAFETAMPDPQLFPVFYEDGYEGLRWTMRQEAVMFFEVVLMEDRSVLEFLDADWAILNGGLAQFYGVRDYDGRVFAFGKEVPRKEYETWRRYRLTDRRRGGVLTMAAVLTTTSAPTRTSAVKRGKWLLESILGAPPPPPPPNAGTLKEDAPELAGLSFRRRLERHRADPGCASCHRRLDPLGLTLENYDPIGRWREKEGPWSPRDGAESWDFNADGDFEGWNGGYQHGPLRVDGGFLKGTAPAMTYLFGPRLAKSATLDRVTVRLRNATPAATLQLSFLTAADGAWTEGLNAPWKPVKSRKIAVVPDSGFREYAFDMAAVPGWKGTITGLRLDLPAAKGTFQIDWIHIGKASERPARAAAIDARATLPDGRAVRGPEELKAALVSAHKDEFVRCLAGHLLTYALGRQLEEEDAPVVEAIARAAARDGYRFSALVREVVKSYPFLNRRTKEAGDE